MKTILIVEDYDAIRLLMKDYLEKSGYRVLQAANGDQAVEIARRERHDLHLILLDLSLPIIDGIVATRLIREITELSEIPIIACTARSSKEQREEALSAGCTDLVAKPIGKTTIENILNEYFGNNIFDLPNGVK